jgi:hypothetical protein
MEHNTRQGAPVGLFVRLVRWTVPWIVLGIVVALIADFSGQFLRAAEARGASSAVPTATVESTGSIVVTGAIAPSAPATKTPVATAVAPIPGKSVAPAAVSRIATVTPPPTGGRSVAVTLVPGIPLRTWAIAGSGIVADLAQGTVLEIIGEKAEWYQVKDPTGKTGWVKSDPALVRTEKR